MIQFFCFSDRGFCHTYILRLILLFRGAQVFQRLMQPIVTPETLRVHPVRELQERVQRRSLDIEYVSAKVGTMFKVDILLDGERVATGNGMKVDAARKVAAKEVSRNRYV
jgi:dsRNA-specific ribonuclease